jgi:hypothetical protein
MKRALALTLAFFVCAPLFAWSEKGHYIVSEAATMSLPTDMPQFFYRAFPQLIWLAYDPDRWRGSGPSLDAANPPDHFIDYEYVAPLTLPPDRYKFIALLGTSGTLRRHGLENSWTGFLPWRIAEMAEQLTNEWRQWRTASPETRRFIEADIIRDAGVLGHFAGDASNPHHATYNFNGWVDPNPNGYPTDCGTHDRFERYFVSHAMSTSDVTPLVKPPALLTDYFAAALAEVRESNSLVEPLYRLDRDGAFALVTPPSRQGVEFTASRLAAGASMLRDLWWSSWKNSAKPRRGSFED